MRTHNSLVSERKQEKSMTFVPTRRRFAMLGAAVPAMIAFASYGRVASAAQATPEASTQGSLLPPAEGMTQYPLTLNTAWGEVTIPERPERVVAASWRG